MAADRHRSRARRRRDSFRPETRARGLSHRWSCTLCEVLACWRRACTSWLISDTSATTEDTEAGYMGAAFVDVEDRGGVAGVGGAVGKALKAWEGGLLKAWEGACRGAEHI